MLVIDQSTCCASRWTSSPWTGGPCRPVSTIRTSFWSTCRLPAITWAASSTFWSARASPWTRCTSSAGASAPTSSATPARPSTPASFRASPVPSLSLTLNVASIESNPEVRARPTFTQLGPTQKYAQGPPSHRWVQPRSMRKTHLYTVGSNPEVCARPTILAWLRYSILSNTLWHFKAEFDSNISNQLESFFHSASANHWSHNNLGNGANNGDLVVIFPPWNELVDVPLVSYGN